MPISVHVNSSVIEVIFLHGYLMYMV